MSDHARKMTDDEQNEAMAKVQDCAAKLGLFGLMILSPRCPDCGACHGFALTASAVDDHHGEDAVSESVAALLHHFAEVAENRRGDWVERKVRQ